MGKMMMKKLFSFMMLALAFASMSAMAEIPDLMDGTDAAVLKQSEEAREQKRLEQPAASNEAMNMMSLKSDKVPSKLSEPSPYLTEMIYRF
jgi:hypothetical protein